MKKFLIILFILFGYLFQSLTVASAQGTTQLQSLSNTWLMESTEILLWENEGEQSSTANNQSGHIETNSGKSLSGTIQDEVENTLNEQPKSPLEVISGKRLEMITSFNKTSLENKISELEGLVKQKNIEISTLEWINGKHKQKIAELQNIRSEESEEYRLEIESYKEAIRKNNETLASIQADKLNNELILESLAKVQKEHEARDNREFNKKVSNILFIIGLLLFIYLLSIGVYKYYRKKLSSSYWDRDMELKISKVITRMNVVNVLTLLLFGFVLASSIIYIKPELAVWFLFFGSAFIVVFKDALVSFVASIVIIAKFNIWDDILYEFWGNKLSGKITKLTSLNMVIREIADEVDRTAYSWRIINIPNKTIFEQNVIKNSSNYSNFVYNHVDIPIKTHYSEANKEEWVEMKNKLDKVEELLNSSVQVIPQIDRGLYGNVSNKYKKSFRSNEKEYIIITYKWLEERWTTKIKDGILEILLWKK